MKFYINGYLLSPEDARIPVADRFFAFGHGLQTPVLCLNSKFFELDSRMESLRRTAAFWQFDFVWSDGDLREALCSTYESLKTTDQLIQFDLYLTIGRSAPAETDGAKKRAALVIEPSIVVIPRKKHDPLDLLAVGVKLQSVSSSAFSGEGLERSRFLLANSGHALVNRLAQKEGANLACIFGDGGTLTHCSGGDLGIIAEKTLVLRQSEEAGHLVPILGSLLDDLGLKVSAQEVTRADLEAGEEGFVLSPDWQIFPIESIDGKAIGKGTPGVQTKELARRLTERVLGGMKAPF